MATGSQDQPGKPDDGSTKEMRTENDATKTPPNLLKVPLPAPLSSSERARQFAETRRNSARLSTVKPTLPTAPGSVRPPVTPAPAPISPARTSGRMSPTGNFSIPAMNPLRPSSSTSTKLPAQPGAASGTSGKWNCTSCGKILGPQSTLQGTSILLEGMLLCVNCVKGRRNKANVVKLSPKTLLLVGGAIVLALCIAAVFIPGQVLMVVAALSVIAILTGAVGFTLSGTARLSAIAAGLTFLLGSTYGLVWVRTHIASAQTQHVAAAEEAQVNHLLEQGCVMEARRYIGGVELDAMKNNAGVPGPLEKALIARLNARVDDWIATTYGKLSQPEHDLLLSLIAKFGSLTMDTHQPFVRAVKIDGSTVKLTLGTDAASATRVAQNTETGAPLTDEVYRLYTAITAAARSAESIELTLVSGPVKSETPVKTYALDVKTLSEIPAMDPAKLKEAIEKSERQ